MKLRKRMFEFFRVCRVSSKGCKIIPCCLYAALRCIILWYLFGESISFYCGDKLELAEEFFSPLSGNFILLILSYFQYGIPLLGAVFYLKFPLCDEYFYSRVSGRPVIILGKICVLFILSAASRACEYLAFGVLSRALFDLGYMYEMFLFSVMLVFVLLLLLLLGSLVINNIYTVYLIITAAVIAGSELHVFTALYNGVTLAQLFFAAILLVIIIILLDRNRIVSIEGDSKNG